MKNQLDYKKRNQLIIWGIPFLLIILVVFVFSGTWELYRENVSIKAKIAQAESAPEQIGTLNYRLKAVKTRFDAYSLDSIKNREYLLQIVSSFCKKNQLILKEFPQIALEEHQSIGVATNTIVAEGNYRNLLSLLYELEQKVGIGRPTSVSFEKNYDFKRKREILKMTIFLQTITNKDEI